MSAAREWLPSEGETVGRYEIVTPLARGGMSAVYVARLPSLAGVEKLFALKVPLPHCQNDEGSLAMFLDEARIAVRIEHPNVAQIYELGEQNGQPFIVMELVSGQSLSALTRRARAKIGALDHGTYFRILADAARGLHAAHEATGSDGEPLLVVHRDISPQNLHVGYDGRVKIVDFGIARARGRITKTESGTIKGKYRYLAPEQVSSGAIDRRTDIWALGVMLWEFCAERALFRADDEAATLWNVIHKEVPALSTIWREVPPELDRIVASCLERDKNRRPATALELAEVLEPLAAKTSTTKVAAVMEMLFADDRAASQERLRTPIHRRPGPALPEVATKVESGVRSRSESKKSSRISRVWTAAILGVIAVGAFTLGWVLLAEPSAPPPAPAPERTATPASSAQEPAAPVIEPAPLEQALPTKTTPPAPVEERRVRPRRAARRANAPAETSAPTPAAGPARPNSPLLDNPYP